MARLGPKPIAMILVLSVASVGALPAAHAGEGEPTRVSKAWDVAMGAGVYSDYIFRGISQSNRRPSVNAYVEPRYNINNSLQLFTGVGGWAVSYPNRAAAEIDFYGGFRPTFGAIEFELAIWYLYYPGGQCFDNTLDLSGNIFGFDCYLHKSLPVNGNVSKADLSYVDYFGKVTWNAHSNFKISGAVAYDPNWANTAASATSVAGSLRLRAPSDWLPKGVGAYISAGVGRHWFGTTDAFGCTSGTVTAANAPKNPPPAGQCGGAAPPAFPVSTLYPLGIPLPGYTAWNIGVGMTWSVFTVDIRYSNTSLNEAECNVLTGDASATYNPNTISAINPGGYGSKLCGQALVFSLVTELTYGDNIR